MDRIDHIIVKTDNFAQTIEEFRDAGFSVFYGTKKEKAYNALVYLQDHCFIEILRISAIPVFFRWLTKRGILKRISTFFNRMGNFHFKEGPIVDYPVYSPNIEEFHKRVKNRSSGIVKGKRKKPNKTVVRFKVFGAKDLNFPFVISDYYPEKISPDETNVHANGILGVQKLAISVSQDMEQFRTELVNYFAIEENKVAVGRDTFSIKTDNAEITYRQSSKDSIHQIVLFPLNVEVNEKLGKYGITTANKILD